eukprot:5269604-Lingulodinium_polyedra.AAC.1
MSGAALGWRLEFSVSTYFLFLLVPNEKYDPVSAATLGVLKSVVKFFFAHGTDCGVFSQGIGGP